MASGAEPLDEEPGAGPVRPGTEQWEEGDRQQVPPRPRRTMSNHEETLLINDDRRDFPWCFLSTSWPGRASGPRAAALTILSLSRPLQVLDLLWARVMPQGKRHSLRVCECSVWASESISTLQTPVNPVSFGQFIVRP